MQVILPKFHNLCRLYIRILDWTIGKEWKLDFWHLKCTGKRKIRHQRAPVFFLLFTTLRFWKWMDPWLEWNQVTATKAGHRYSALSTKLSATLLGKNHNLLMGVLARLPLEFISLSIVHIFWSIPPISSLAWRSGPTNTLQGWHEEG